uniref:F-box domain-containing protein n=1 Tax=Plectus sambesii TaxID=2011161 RepID=A0A914V5J2_9BILA
MSVADLEAEVTNLHAEIDRLRRALGDVSGQIVCGRLTGDLPDNFLEQFSKLPDRPLEQVLRFLPARQVVQMRYVSRKFNHLIRKCSKTMPKIKRDGTVLFGSNQAGGFLAVWFDDCGNNITTTTLEGDEVALSELLRFIRIGGRMFFSHGLSAADEVLDQLSKAWVTIRPDVVIFSGDLSQTSRDSLRAFLVKVEPTIRRLHFQYASNIGHNLLSNDVISAAGQLNGLMIKPVCYGSKLPDYHIGEDTLLAMADTDHVFSYFLVKGCTGITPGGIRAFIEKWMRKERPKVDAKLSRFEEPMGFCKLTFYKCANVTAAAVEEACGDLLEKDTSAEAVVDRDAAMEERVHYTIQCPSNNCFLEILFNVYPFYSHCVSEPIMDYEMEYNYGDHYNGDLEPEIEDHDFDDHDGYGAIDYDEIEDSDVD